jgi:serine O-acetyltransferase
MNWPLAVSATTADWSREVPRCPWDPGRKLLKSIRDYQRVSQKAGVCSALLKKVIVLRHRFWSIVTQSEIDLTCRIEGGLLLTHPNGIVIHPKVTIGPNCLIFHQVTLGTGGSIPGVPSIGGHVDIGAGAKVLGGVKIGDHVKIGANAVVLCDVPDGSVAVGVPARVV